MADTLTITGKFLGAGKIKTIGQNNKPIRAFWLDVTDKPEYPNTPEFQLWGDKVYLVDNIQPGQLIQVKFNLNGRKFEKDGRKGVITNLDAWKIEILQYQSAASTPAPQPARQPAPVTAPVRQAPVQQPTAASLAASFGNFDEDNNDLPF